MIDRIKQATCKLTTKTPAETEQMNWPQSAASEKLNCFIRVSRAHTHKEATALWSSVFGGRVIDGLATVCSAAGNVCVAKQWKNRSFRFSKTSRSFMYFHRMQCMSKETTAAELLEQRTTRTSDTRFKSLRKTNELKDAMLITKHFGAAIAQFYCPPLNGKVGYSTHGNRVNRCSQGRAISPEFLPHLVIFLLWEGCPKQNTVARLKWKGLAPKFMLSWLHYWPQRSLGKNVHLNRPGKKQKSGFGLHPIAVTNIILKKNA